MMEECGLQLFAIDVSEMALRNVMRAYPDVEGSVALLRLDGRSGVVDLIREGQLDVPRVPFIEGEPGAEGTPEAP